MLNNEPTYNPNYTIKSIYLCIKMKRNKMYIYFVVQGE